MHDDLRTIQRVLRGEIEAFRLLVEKYQKPLFAMIHNMLTNPADCEDICARDVFGGLFALGLVRFRREPVLDLAVHDRQESMLQRGEETKAGESRLD